MTVKPFLRWAGGKQNLIDELSKNCPDFEKTNRYFEPFLGAGSLFFLQKSEIGVISDINPQLINSYNQIKKDYKGVDRFLKGFEKEFKNDSNFYYQIRMDFNLNREKFNLVQAARFIFLIHSNYNGMYRLNNKGEYNVPIGKLKPNIPSIEHLKAIQKKLKSFEIKCFEYKDILADVKANDFVYLDPPYPPMNWNEQSNQYTVNRFSREDHQNVLEFANCLKSKDCFVMISYPDTEYIRELYSGWKIVELSTIRSISGLQIRKKAKELIIKNY